MAARNSLMLAREMTVTSLAYPRPQRRLLTPRRMSHILKLAHFTRTSGGLARF